MLETERLILRLYKIEEKSSFVELFTNDEAMKFVEKGVFSQERIEKLWQKLHFDFYPKGIDTIFAVFAKENSRYIGHAAIRPRPSRKGDWEISYFLKPDEWGKGFATEIAKGLIEFGFNELSLKEVFATIDDENLDSIKVVEKAGMSFSCYEFDEDGRFSVYSIKSK